MFRNIKNRKGQSLVETALILPLLLLIVFAIIEFGRIFNAYLIITSASREGARIAAISNNDVEVKNAITLAASTLDATKLRITIQPSGTDRKQGNQVTVLIDYSVDIISPIVAELIPDPFIIKSTTVMRVE